MRVRNLFFVLSTFLLFAQSLSAQLVKTPVFSAKFSKTEVKAGETVDIIIYAQIPIGWHLFSEKTDCPEGEGPIEAEISFSPSSSYQLVGKFHAVGDKMHKDEIFECSTGELRGKGEFRQTIRALSDISGIDLVFDGQMCTDDENGQCVKVKGKANTGALKVSGKAEPVKTNTPSSELPSTDANKTSASANPADCGCVEDILRANGFNIPEKNTPSSFSVTKSNTPHYKKSSDSDNGNCNPKQFKGENTSAESSYWSLFIFALISGFAGLLTPCVFPMIPMTVSFFMKDKSRAASIRDGILFSISLVGIYTILGTAVAYLFGASAANWVSTHWIPNMFFFIIFIVFAASFFGAFEIVLPAWLVNKADRQADKGGFLGPFFMAITIALVSFSCTGPIVGTVLVQSIDGNLMRPIVAMFGFGLAFALPFGILAIFPNMLKSLPKSGGWLNSVKVVLGFVELAFALKFLSTADQTYHWRLLDREIYLAIWIVIFFLMGLYLLGKLKFSHDSDLPFLKVPRLMLAIATFSFVVYLIPGMWGAPLKALAGYLPPMSTQDFVGGGKNDKKIGLKSEEPLYGNLLHLPHNLNGYFDYEQGLKVARELKKPVFIDFTGHGCVNCRKMEEKVWSDPEVLKLLSEEYVILSLYVDDKKIKLSPNDQFIGRSSGDKITTLGDKNAEIEACYFGMNSQPLYILLDQNEEMLQPRVTAESNNYDARAFADFLRKGAKEFKSRLNKS